MVGARKLYPEKNLLVVDIGTCITMDVLTNDGIFLGGRISPDFILDIKVFHLLINYHFLILFTVKIFTEMIQNLQYILEFKDQLFLK